MIVKFLSKIINLHLEKVCKKEQWSKALFSFLLKFADNSTIVPVIYYTKSIMGCVHPK